VMGPHGPGVPRHGLFPPPPLGAPPLYKEFDTMKEGQVLRLLRNILLLSFFFSGIRAFFASLTPCRFPQHSDLRRERPKKAVAKA